MNSKLRRILRRKRSNADDKASKKRDKPALPALLSDRTKAEPNYYFNNNEPSGATKRLEEDDDKEKGDDLIVNTDPVEPAPEQEEQGAENALLPQPLIIDLEPLECSRETPPRHANLRENARNAAASLEERPKTEAGEPQGQLEFASMRRAAAASSFQLHNSAPRASYATGKVMQPRLVVPAAERRAIKPDQCGSEASAAPALSAADIFADCADFQDWEGFEADSAGSDWADPVHDMKRHHPDSTTADLRWGWVSQTRDVTPCDVTVNRCSCDFLPTPVDHHHHLRRSAVNNCCSSTPAGCDGCAQGMTSQRARNKWQQESWRAPLPRSHSRSCFRAAHQCRNRRLQHQVCSSCHPCSCSSSTSSPTEEAPRRSRSAVLFTILDEDAVERRPRILEFDNGPEERREDDGFSFSSYDSHPDSRDPRCCGCEQCDINSESMDWCDEEFNCTQKSSHCFATNAHPNSVSISDCLQFSNNVNQRGSFVTSQPASPSMAPSVGFFNQAESPVVAQQQNGHNNHHQHQHNNRNSSAAAQCCCRRSARAMTSRTRHQRQQTAKRVDSAERRPVASTSLAHFELSKRSYAKLIAYCHSKKLLADMYSRSPTPRSNRRQGDFISNTPAFDAERPHSDVCYSAGNRDEFAADGLASSRQSSRAANEICRLARVFETVEECPWYYGAMTGQQARQMLRGTPVGTFLLRDSSDAQHLFSLSLMSKRGATSIRMVNTNGNFHFDSETDESTGNGKGNPSSFKSSGSASDIRRCVVRMILSYTGSLSKTRRPAITQAADSAAPPCGEETASGAAARGSSSERQFLCYWMDQRGSRKEIPIKLAKPLGGQMTSLKQISRACLNRHARLWESPERLASLPLPLALKNYIRKYPYPE